MITRSHTKISSEKTVNQILLQVPLKNSGLVEDKIFKDDFIMENESDVYIEGLPYSQIDKDAEKNQYLQKLRRNMSGYWLKTKHQKYHFFQKINTLHQENVEVVAEPTGNKMKNVSFCDKQTFKIFDKKQTPHNVRLSIESIDALKQ